MENQTINNPNQFPQPKKSGSTLKKIIIAVFIIGFAFYMFGGGIEKQAANNMADIENQVALDAEKQYEIAKSGGDKMDIYVHSGLVAAAYLQAKDEANYKKWKEIEKANGIKVGIVK